MEQPLAFVLAKMEIAGITVKEKRPCLRCRLIDLSLKNDSGDYELAGEGV